LNRQASPAAAFASLGVREGKPFVPYIIDVVQWAGSQAEWLSNVTN
jgi:hypothetical protein